MRHRPHPLLWWAERRVSPRKRRPSSFVLRPSSVSRRRSSRTQMAHAYRLLRAASRLGVPGSLPGPPELLPAGARALAQGYLNRFSMPLLNSWLLPNWMREQSDPACPWFVPRSVVNIMVNQTRRNWTALGIPGAIHSVESLVDRWGLLTPIPGGPSLDWWVHIDGRTDGWMVPSQQREVLQTLQGSLPVVATSYEADGLRVSSEAWMLPLEDADWVAMQVVLFNIADLPLTGTFAFALRPYNSEGISPIYNISYDGATLTADGRPGPYTWPQPQSVSFSGLRSGDLFGRRPTTDDRRPLDSSQSAIRNPQSAIQNDSHGFAHATLEYRFDIEPWEEAEFLAFFPVHTQRPVHPLPSTPLFALQGNSKLKTQNSKLEITPQFYSRAKAATTLEWRALLDSGMRVELPHRDLQASWEANRAHLLALHDGHTITPGPDLYHSFWFRDAAYMTYALSVCGYREAASQLVRGFLHRQRRDGAFISHQGEWDSTGQALWCIAQHLALHPDLALLAEALPAMERGARWIATTLARSPDGLMPPGMSSEHFGPPDHYYWDSIWSLAGLTTASKLPGNPQSVGFPSGTIRNPQFYSRAAVRLRRTLARSWATDMASLGNKALVAAPGRGIDLGMIGALAAWFPLRLVPPDSPLLEGTLTLLEESLFYEGALFVNTGHSGWGTYLNMRLAGCRLLQGSPKGWDAMLWLLRHASSTYNWPEGIHTRSLGGSAGDGQHGWASAEWLMLVRALLFQEDEARLTITPTLPEAWLETAGRLVVGNAPTRFGLLSYNMEWDNGGSAIALSLSPQWRTAPPEVVWRVPGSIRSVITDGHPVKINGAEISLNSGAKEVQVERGSA